MNASTLLIDFGGVLTSNVFDGFEAFCVEERLDPGRFSTLVGSERAAQRLLVEVETGRMREAEFEAAFAPMLGATVSAEGLIDRLTGRLTPDEPMLAAVATLRSAGVTTVLVSNSFGYGAYAGYAFDRLFDHVVISGAIGIRKPSRGIYALALALAKAEAADAVFVDDIARNVAAAERLGIRGVHHVDTGRTLPVLEELFGVGVAA